MIPSSTGFIFKIDLIIWFLCRSVFSSILWHYQMLFVSLNHYRLFYLIDGNILFVHKLGFNCEVALKSLFTFRKNAKNIIVILPSFVQWTPHLLFIENEIICFLNYCPNRKTPMFRLELSTNIYKIIIKFHFLYIFEIFRIKEVKALWLEIAYNSIKTPN